jgi:hypothetical protein
MQAKPAPGHHLEHATPPPEECGTAVASHQKAVVGVDFGNEAGHSTAVTRRRCRGAGEEARVERAERGAQRKEGDDTNAESEHVADRAEGCPGEERGKHADEQAGHGEEQFDERHGDGARPQANRGLGVAIPATRRRRAAATTREQMCELALGKQPRARATQLDERRNAVLVDELRGAYLGHEHASLVLGTEVA